MCKTKPVLSEAWAELSPPQRKERSRRNEEELGGGGGGVGSSYTREKSAPRGKSRQDKDKTDSTPTNKQDPQDTQAGGFQHIIQ